MRAFVADEDVPRPVVEKLRDKGSQVFYVEEEMKGSTDEEVVEKSCELNLPVLSFDNDFFRFGDHQGILHITQRTNYNLVCNAIKEALENIEAQALENSVISINPSQYRRERS